MPFPWKEAEMFLQDLCTPAELKAMQDRWKVVELVKKGVPYRKIHEVTGLTIVSSKESTSSSCGMAVISFDLSSVFCCPNTRLAAQANVLTLWMADCSFE